jgi:hypothetical protein
MFMDLITPSIRKPLPFTFEEFQDRSRQESGVYLPTLATYLTGKYAGTCEG